MQSLIFFLPLIFSPAGPAHLPLSFFFFSRAPNSSLPPAPFPLSAQIRRPLLSAADRRTPPVGVVFLPVGDADSGSPAATRLPAPRLGPHAKDPLRAL